VLHSTLAPVVGAITILQPQLLLRKTLVIGHGIGVSGNQARIGRVDRDAFRTGVIEAIAAELRSVDGQQQRVRRNAAGVKQTGGIVSGDENKAISVRSETRPSARRGCDAAPAAAVGKQPAVEIHRIRGREVVELDELVVALVARRVEHDLGENNLGAGRSGAEEGRQEQRCQETVEHNPSR